MPELLQPSETQDDKRGVPRGDPFPVHRALIDELTGSLPITTHFSLQAKLPIEDQHLCIARVIHEDHSAATGCHPPHVDQIFAGASSILRDPDVRWSFFGPE